MTSNESWRRYLEAGAAVGQLTLARAEEIARGLLAPAEEERSAAWDEFEELTRFGRLMGEQLVEVARSEVTKQLETFGVGSLDQLWGRITDLVGSAGVDEPHQASPTGAIHVPEDLIFRPSEPQTETETVTAHSGQATGQAEPQKLRAKKLKDHKRDGNANKGPRGKKSKKHKKGHKKEKDKDGAGPHWASGTNRVLSLAKPPDSAGTV